MNAIRSLLCAALVLTSGALRAEPLKLIFAGDVMLDDGRTVTAHVANSGSMLGLARPGARVLLRPTASRQRPTRRRGATTSRLSMPHAPWCWPCSAASNAGAAS